MNFLPYRNLIKILTCKDYYGHKEESFWVSAVGSESLAV